MITRIKIKHLGPVDSFECNQLGGINVFIGHNGRGKTQLMKMIYASVWATEQYGRGIEKRAISQLIANKLTTTFLPQKLGDLVSFGSREPLEFEMYGNGGVQLSYSFGKDTTTVLKNVENTFTNTDTNSIFIPAKEVISIRDLVIESRSSRFNALGFDDTYLDLSNALTPTVKGKNYQRFASTREMLKEAIHGKIEYDDEKKEWYFKDAKNRRFSIMMTSEGAKKISVLSVLLGNRFLSPQSMVFIDEIESALHPQLISRFIEVLVGLSKTGMQFFVATHSYAVIKKLYIEAHKHNISIPCCSFGSGAVTIGDLKGNMPQNDIVDESISLYEEELAL